MPRYNFLDKYKKLNINNFKPLAMNLYDKAKSIQAEGESKVDNYFNKLEARKAHDRLNYFIDITKKYLSLDNEELLIRNLRLNPIQVRKYAIQSLKEKLIKYGVNGPRKNELINLLNNDNQNKVFSVIDLGKMIKESIDINYKNQLNVSLISLLPNDLIIRQYEKFIDLIQMDMSDLLMEDIGIMMNNYIPLDDYSKDSPITSIKYVDEINEIINNLKDENKGLSNQEIKENAKVLEYASTLLGDPIIDIELLEKNKDELDNAIYYDHFNQADVNLKKMGFKPDSIGLGKHNTYGFYNVVKDNNKEDFSNLRDNTKIQFSEQTKKGILNVINLIRESKLEKSHIENDVGEKVYGFNKLIELSNKYKTAITSNNIEDKLKAIDYAKEIKELDENLSSILKRIEKIAPLEDNNLAYPKDLDLVNNENIPAKYRMDYARIAHLSMLCELINLIDKYNIDINKFFDEPLDCIRDLYQKEYISSIDPSINNKDLKGVDLIFNLSKKPDNDLFNEYTHYLPRMALGLAYLEKDKNLRMKNVSKIHALNETVFRPYTFAQKYDAYKLSDSIDKLIINPDLTFDDLKLKYYDPNKLSFVNTDVAGFDVADYIKNSTESFDNFKERFDLNLLKYMKLEADYVRKNNDLDSTYFSAARYAELAASALAKVLIIKREDMNDKTYQDLSKFLTNKKQYINNLIDSIPNNPKYSEFIDVKTLKDNPIKINNELYKINTFVKNSDTASIISNYDEFISSTKILMKDEFNKFINEENNLNADLKKKYESYINALNIYQKEVEKVYGKDYKGNIDNLVNNNLKQAFINYTDTRRIYVDTKNNYLHRLDAEVNKGRIPNSYYVDREIQLETDNYSKLPPIFRSDSMMDMNEYIKLRYPNEYDSLSIEEKNLIFDRYKHEIKTKENDFFSLKFLENQKLISKRNNLKLDNNLEEKPIDKYDYKYLENSFLNLEEDYLNEIDYEKPFEPFNELIHLRMKSESINDFKKNLDNKLLKVIKEYDNKDINNLPDIEKVIDLSQKAALKYLLVVSTYNRDDNNVNELSDLLVDGKSYINNLVNKENNRINKINLDEAKNIPTIKYDIKKAKINDLNINKYSNSIKDFNNYFNKEIRNTDLVEDLQFEENDTTIVLKEIDAYLKELRYEKTLDKQKIMHNPTDPAPIILAIADTTKEEYLKLNIDERIEDCKETYDFVLSGIKTRLEHYYSRGQIPKEYVDERMRRIYKKDYSIPKKFIVDDLPGMDKYIKIKYPTLANEFTMDEKKDIYLNYIRECEENRRQFILRNYLVEKGITSKRLYNINELNLNKSKELLAKQTEKINEIEKNLDIDSNENNIDLPKFDNISEISNDDELNLNEIMDFDIKDDYNAKNIAKEEIEYIRKNDHFTKWIDNLKEVIKEELGEEEYEGQSIEENFKYDPVTDSFNFWLDNHLQALEMIFENDNLNDVFSSVTSRLDEESKKLFVDEIRMLPEFRKYFEDEIQRFPYTPFYDSPVDDYNLADADAFNDFVKQLKKDLAEKQIDAEEIEDIKEENESLIIKK